MIYNFDAAELLKQGFAYAVVLQYDRSLAEPRGTLLSKHKSLDAAGNSRAAKQSDTMIIDLNDARQDQEIDGL